MQIYTEIDRHTENDTKDIALCKEIYDILDIHYSGHLWQVGANSETGIIDIKLLYPDGRNRITNFGYTLKIKDIEPPYIKKKVIKAGGELLERYGLPRGRATLHTLVDAITNGLDKTGRVR